MPYDNETRFEEDLISLLTKHFGWEKEVLMYPTEEDLIRNWKEILFRNNRGIDQLNDVPLTDGEMQQILAKIKEYRTPYQLNKKFINGGHISIKRDNPQDELHFGKEVSLKIYNRNEIAGGKSYYQIARQPKFNARREILPDRRGDFMLLINGMPVFHVELKRTDIPVSQAAHQIELYANEGIYTGILSLVQVFVAMNPEESIYFANPGPDGKFNQNFYFHWADFNNTRINEWQNIAEQLLSIPMAHQLIGFYSVADAKDESLKVLRSYQYYAVRSIDQKVSQTIWDDKNHQYGGYVWHTTGSGKTLTSFKAAQLISEKENVDKVVFLLDRIELGTQTLGEYQNFADDATDVQDTANTQILMQKLESNDKAINLIVTSIQKFNILASDDSSATKAVIEKINQKRIVCIIDEAHRSVFGDMLINIKHAFTNMVFFGFTGTPIFDENKKKDNTTADLFGPELHRYSITDGINDHNVLGFDPTMVETYKEQDLREAVALDMVKAKTKEEVMNDPKRRDLYFKVIKEFPMAGYVADDGTHVRGIEDYLPVAQFEREEHQKAVVNDIKENWFNISCDSKFHALFATSSINEAIAYYRLFKQLAPELKVTALFDKNIDNNGNGPVKEDGLIEILEDYNKRYNKSYTITTHGIFKDDIGLRLAHKVPYTAIENDKSQQIDILIVVDQMLTGFDSKWINTLYLDKVLQYERIIQAFSRTNRIFSGDKPFGTIRYYRYVHTMKRNIDLAVGTYCGDKPFGLFVSKLKDNLNILNTQFDEIKAVFDFAGIKNFEKLPDDKAVRQQFAKLFHEFHSHLEAAQIQGFSWNQQTYEFVADDGIKTVIDMHFDNLTYATLLTRYKELFSSQDPDDPTKGSGDLPYDIDTYITAIDTGQIDAEYMNTNFKKFMKMRQTGEETDQIRKELHRSFAALPQDEQQYAQDFMLDVENGNVTVDESKTLREYITEYKVRATNDRICKFAASTGIDADQLRELINLKVTAGNLDEFGRFTKLMESLNLEKAKTYLESKLGLPIPAHRIKMKIENIVRNFILNGGIEQ